MLFRWSIWGDKPRTLEMLRYSIATFRATFGGCAEYRVYTDEPLEVAMAVGDLASTLAYDEHPTVTFDVDSPATWRKWCPAVRVTEHQTEVYVDSDVFIVGDPVELHSFCVSEGDRFLALLESFGERWCFGKLETQVPRTSPFINAGLIGQQNGADLGETLLKYYEWWCENIVPSDVTFHDEQGAVVAALNEFLPMGRVELLPRERYRNVSPRSNNQVTDLDETALIHATHPEHPAFELFKKEIREKSRL